MPSLEDIITAAWGNPETRANKSRINWPVVGDASKQVAPPLPTDYKAQVESLKGQLQPSDGFADRLFNTVAAAGIGGAMAGPPGAAAMAVGANLQGLNRGLDDVLAGLDYIPGIGMAIAFPLSKGPKQVFHSGVENAFRELKVGEHTKMPEAQTMAWLRGVKGISPMEIDDLKLTEFFKSDPNPTKSKILDWIANNKVQLYERVLEEAVPAYRSHAEEAASNIARDTQMADKNLPEDLFTSNAPYWKQYTAPGGENYREFSMVMPGEKQKVYDVVDQHGQNWGSFDTPEEARRRMYNVRANYPDTNTSIKEGIAGGANFSYPAHDIHHQPENTLYFMRTKDRTLPSGENVISLEETQSDWRSDIFKALKGTQPETLESVQQSSEYKIMRSLKDKGYSQDDINDFKNPDIMLDPDYIQYLNQNRADSRSEAPKSHNLVEKHLDNTAKRLIRLAVDEDKDGITIVPGEEHAKRWNKEIVNNIERLEYNPKTNTLYIHKPNGSVATKYASITELPGLIGEKPAMQLIEALPPKPANFVDRRFDPIQSFLSPEKQARITEINDLLNPLYSESTRITREATDTNGWNIFNWDHYNEIANKINNLHEERKNLEREGRALRTKYVAEYKSAPIPSASISGKDISIGGTGYIDIYNKQLPKLISKYLKRYTGKEVKPEIRKVEIEPGFDIELLDNNPFKNLTGPELHNQLTELMDSAHIEGDESLYTFAKALRSDISYFGYNYFNDPEPSGRLTEILTAYPASARKLGITLKTEHVPAVTQSHLFFPIDAKSKSILHGQTFSPYMIPAAVLGGDLLTRQIRAWQSTKNPNPNQPKDELQ